MKRMEDSCARMEMEKEMSGAGGGTKEMDGGKEEEEKVVVEEVTNASQPPAALASTLTSSPTHDPSASIMEMMKEIYDNGDDNMKKMIRRC